MIKKVIRLKLTCRECHTIGFVEFDKKDLKKLRALLSKPPQFKSGLWSRHDHHVDPKKP